MTDPLSLEVTVVAARQIRAAEEWWRINRTAAPHAVREALQRAFTLITTQPRIGSRASATRVTDVRRAYLPTIGYHVYYRVTEPPQRVEVLALWHSRRGSRPPI